MTGEERPGETTDGMLCMAVPRWKKDGGDPTTDQHIGLGSLLIDRGTQMNTDGLE